MVENSKQNTENNPFLQLSDTQWRYITARIENPQFNIKQAAEHIGVAPTTVYNWDNYVSEALELAREDLHGATITMRKQALLKAMAVKVALLDSDDENVRQRAANDLIEWELGKAGQPITGADGGELKFVMLFKEKHEDD